MGTIKTRFSLVIVLLVALVFGNIAYLLSSPQINYWWVAGATVLFLALLLALYYFVEQSLLLPLEKIKAFSENITEKAVKEILTDEYPKEIRELMGQLQRIAQNLDDATQFVIGVGRGDFQKEIGSLQEKQGLGRALIEMRDRLRLIAIEEGQRNWSINGIAKFSNLLRDTQHLEPQEASFGFIKNLVEYLRANQGAVYLIEDAQPQDKHIYMAAAYAYSRRKYLKKRIEIGEGLIGRCILEEDVIYMDDLPADYLIITSGLGQATPKSLIIAPIIVNEQIFGAVEMASFQRLQEHEIEFVRTICQNFAATLSGTRSNLRTKQLLGESQRITKELQEKEEALQKRTEELMVAQQQLQEKILEVEQESVRTRSIVEAINKTNASLELDLEGRITDVNDIYLSLMEYSKTELLGKRERELISREEAESGRYQVMWESITAGAFNSGEFKRISKSGKELWISGTYSPILDLNGKPYKIVQFAQFTTEQKEKELEYSSKVAAINESIALVEADLEGNLIRGNALFMKLFDLKKRTQLRATTLSQLLQVGEEELAEILRNIQQGRLLSKHLPMRSLEGREMICMVSFSPTKNLSGQVYKVIVTLLDITELHQLREHFQRQLVEEKRKNVLLNMQVEYTDAFVHELAEVLARADKSNQGADFNALLENKPIPYLELDNRGVIVRSNQQIADLLGEVPEQSLGDSIFEKVIFEVKEQKWHFEEQLRRPEVAQMKLQLKLSDSNAATFNVLLAPYFKSAASKRFDMFVFLLNLEPPTA
jgi:PAS domain S-box-containing protein